MINAKKQREKNRIGKSRDLVKKIRDTKGTFHPKMGQIKDRNCMDLKEAEIVWTCLLRNQYAGQEVTVRTGHGTTDWERLEISSGKLKVPREHFM